MKSKSTLLVVFAVLFMSGHSHANVLDVDPPNCVEVSIHKNLIDLGYDSEMINDLFGDEYFYFPRNDSELDLSYYVVDKIIENGQYTSSDRDKLRTLAADAFDLYQNQQVSSVAPKCEK